MTLVLEVAPAGLVFVESFQIEVQQRYMIREYVPLARMTTMNVGGDARYFFSATTEDGVRRASLFAREHKLPIFVLGGGSNIVLGDKGFPGLVIRMEIMSVSFFDKGDRVLAVAGAGVPWDSFVASVGGRGLHGVENLSLIPGTVGGAPIQNIGAYGQEAAETIAWVEAVDVKTGDLVRIPKYRCEFGYRRSMFQSRDGARFVIVRVAFDLPKEAPFVLSYDGVEEEISRAGISPSLASVRAAISALRRNKLPDVRMIGTAGSFFKNPIIPRAEAEELVRRIPGARVTFLNDGRAKVSAAWLLDAVCGYKGARAGSVGVYDKHALVLVHYGGGTASDIKKLSEEMAECVREKTGIMLEREVQFVGE